MAALDRQQHISRIRQLLPSVGKGGFRQLDLPDRPLKVDPILFNVMVAISSN